MIGNTGCCGSGFRKEGVTLWGLATLSLPLALFSACILPLFFLLGLVNSRMRRLKEMLLIIIRANLALIHSTPLSPKARCVVSGKIFSISPKISGAIYRSFNFSLLFFLWVSFITVFYLVIR